MAHSCPVCGCTCHCGGDIDDICFDSNEELDSCTCCDEFEEDDEDFECWYDDDTSEPLGEDTRP